MVATGRKSTFLFWNLNGRNLSEPVAALAREADAEVVILAEAAGLDVAAVLRRFDLPNTYFEASRSSGNLRILTRVETSVVRSLPTASGSRWRMDRLLFREREDLLLVSVHLRSKLWADSAEQYALARRLGREILNHEAKLGHRRTLIIGDFNMNPEEDGMLACDALHSCMSRREMERRQGSRRWDSMDYPMFFNPMWSHLGDRSGRVPGTYFYGEGVAVARFWHMYDQVLLRSELLPSFTDDDVRIAVQVGSASLLDPHGRPDTSNYSDHLPLLVRLEF